LPDPEGENTTILELTDLEYERIAFFELPDPAAEISTILRLFAPEDEMLTFDTSQLLTRHSLTFHKTSLFSNTAVRTYNFAVNTLHEDGCLGVAMNWWIQGWTDM